LLKIATAHRAMRTITPRTIQPTIVPSLTRVDRYELLLDFERFEGKKKEGGRTGER